jgi:hypothetical protein
MITVLTSTAVAAGAAPAQVAPASINPIPFDGFIEILGVSDPAAGLTGLPSLAVQLGQGAGQGAAPSAPFQTSVVPLNSFNAAFVGPDMRNLLMPRTAVRGAQQIQVLVAGGAGAATVVRLMIRLYTPDEIASSGSIAVF